MSAGNQQERPKSLKPAKELLGILRDYTPDTLQKSDDIVRSIWRHIANINERS